MKTDKKMKQKLINTKIQNYTEFVDTIKNNEKEDVKAQMQKSADYIEYIKAHDEEAYKKYLSYSTYLYTVPLV